MSSLIFLVRVIENISHCREDFPMCDELILGRIKARFLRHMAALQVLEEVGEQTYSMTRLAKAFGEPRTRDMWHFQYVVSRCRIQPRAGSNQLICRHNIPVLRLLTQTKPDISCCILAC